MFQKLYIFHIIIKFSTCIRFSFSKNIKLKACKILEYIFLKCILKRKKSMLFFSCSARQTRSREIKLECESKSREILIARFAREYVPIKTNEISNWLFSKFETSIIHFLNSNLQLNSRTIFISILQSRVLKYASSLSIIRESYSKIVT